MDLKLPPPFVDHSMLHMDTIWPLLWWEVWKLLTLWTMWVSVTVFHGCRHLSHFNTRCFNHLTFVWCLWMWLPGQMVMKLVLSATPPHYCKIYWHINHKSQLSTTVSCLSRERVIIDAHNIAFNIDVLYNLLGAKNITVVLYLLKGNWPQWRHNWYCLCWHDLQWTILCGLDSGLAFRSWFCGEHCCPWVRPSLQHATWWWE